MKCNTIILLLIGSSCLVGSTNQLTSAETISASDEDDDEKLAQNCARCRLTSHSIEDLIRKPRPMNAYGKVEERVDLDKIKKAVCKDIVSDSEREDCRDFFYTNLAIIEKWKQYKHGISFFDFVCIKELKYCCPRNSYGPRCTRCSACEINQHCQGEGTRFGSGVCVCNEGHTGPDCGSCKRGYHAVIARDSQASSKNKQIVCLPCHRSCQYCRNEGPLGCEVCRSGFTWIPAYGCSDIDECAQDKKICGDNTFCVNTEGSHYCYECDRACDGCHGDGPDMCQKCATGYKMEKGNCVALKKTLIPPEVDYYRYAIYFGLSLCSCIISYNNIYLASLVGLGVALYVGFSEYVMTIQYSNMMKEMGRASNQ